MGVDILMIMDIIRGNYKKKGGDALAREKGT